MISQNDHYCFVSERYRQEYRGIEFEVVKIDQKQSTVRNTKTGGLLRLPNEELYSTVQQRIRSLKRKDQRARYEPPTSSNIRKRR